VIDEGTDPSAANCQTAPPNFPNVQCASISVFAMTKGSTSLSEVAGSPFPVGRIPSALSAITFTPPASATLPCAATTDFLYVTFSSDPVLHNDNTLSAYCVDSSGTPNDLTANVPYNVPSSDPISVLAVNTTPAGENTGGVFVYVGSQPSASGALSIFQMCTQSGHGNCTPPQVTNETLIPVLPVPSAPGEKPVGMVVDPTNNYLYVVCELSNQVFGYRISSSTGTLTALNPVSRPTGSQPVALAMQPSVNSGGEFLYVSNSNSSNITGFTVSTTTGTMGDPITVISNPGPSGMAAQQ
jgi:DNA-binding beta-propeller fold protein YncE